MMMKLKCLYGKLLKQFFIISLISCFTLLGNSSVNAAGYFGNVNDDFSISNYNNAYELSVGLHGNFFTRFLNSQKMLFMPGKGNFIFWSDSGLPYIYNSSYISDYNGGYTYSIQGLATKYFVCPVSGLNSFTTLNDLVCTPYNIDNSSVNAFKNVLADLGSNDNYFYYWGYPWINSQNRMEFLFCFVLSDNSNALCFGNSSLNDGNGFYGGISGTGNLFDTDRNNVSFDSINSFLLKLSPYRSSGTGSSSVQFKNIDQMQYQALFEKGYRSQLCYGGFTLDNVFGSGDVNSSFGDIMAGSGATVFELYTEYNSGESFSTWYDNNYLDYYYLMGFKDEYEWSRYVGKSKGLVGLGLVRDSYFKGTDFDSNDLSTFCSLVLDNRVNVDNTSAISLLDGALGEKVMRDLIGDVGILVPTTGDAMSTLFNQYFSGSDCGTPEECLANADIFDSIEKAWKNWSFRGITDGVNGILPGYIVIGFLGIVLLYILRK